MARIKIRTTIKSDQTRFRLRYTVEVRPLDFKPGETSPDLGIVVRLKQKFPVRINDAIIQYIFNGVHRGFSLFSKPLVSPVEVRVTGLSINPQPRNSINQDALERLLRTVANSVQGSVYAVLEIERPPSLDDIRALEASGGTPQAAHPALTAT